MQDADGFEGPEKLLEVWFSGDGSLRDVQYEQWIKLLNTVQCEVLSHISNETVDAYLLSESSMFMYANKIILKTCGTTTLLMCLECLFKFAREQGLCNVEYLFYSRKNFMFPHQQAHPHTSWQDEVDHLERYFMDGSAYVVGKTNTQHHWFCYVWESHQTSPTTDVTLEILMSNLCPQTSKVFYPASARDKDGQLLTTVALKEVFDDMIDIQVDDHQFEPCGYSCNALLQDAYFNVHVTPEDHCSYASFETNIQLVNYDEIVNKVVAIFKPSVFTVTLFSERSYDSLNTLQVPKQFYKRDKIIYEFDTYNLVFNHYEKKAPSRSQKKEQR